MCDWIIAHMPWLVEHVGGMPLAWQTVLAVALIAAVVLVYYIVGVVINGIQQPRRRARAKEPRRAERINWLDRNEHEAELEYDWVDPAKAEAWE